MGQVAAAPLETTAKKRKAAEAIPESDFGSGIRKGLY